jgi:lipid-A-disaccharide synthase
VGDLRERRILIVAGEASGDAHAARLVRALRALGPVRVRGVAGPASRAAGVECVVPMERLAVLGFAEILARLPALLQARRRLLAEHRAFRPDAVVLVDYPGFNLRLGPTLKRLGARIFYYIAPQVWAWHPERAREMARWVDRLAVVFRFEEKLFRDAGVEARWVGHPLLDDLAPECDAGTLRAELGAGSGAPILGLLPGSRPQEISRLLPALLEIAAAARRAQPALVPCVAAAPGVEAPLYARAERAGLRVLTRRTHAIQAHATACVVASGTATLETALFGTPLAIVYRVGRLNYAIARRLVTLRRIGLPNIVSGQDVAPEFVQDALRADDVAAALAPWLSDPAKRDEASRRLSSVRAELGEPGASRRAAEELWALASA